MLGELGREEEGKSLVFRGCDARENLIICSRHQHWVFVAWINLQMLCEKEALQDSA